MTQNKLALLDGEIDAGEAPQRRGREGVRPWCVLSKLMTGIVVTSVSRSSRWPPMTPMADEDRDDHAGYGKAAVALLRGRRRTAADLDHPWSSCSGSVAVAVLDDDRDLSRVPIGP